MKRLLIALALILLLSGCASRGKQAAAYLRDAFPSVAYEIMEVNKEVPLYNPHLQLITISSAAARYTAGEIEFSDLEKIAQRFEDANGNPEGYAVEHPEECNTNGFSAFVNFGSVITKITFYYGDSNKIVDSSLAQQQRYEKILSSLF